MSGTLEVVVYAADDLPFLKLTYGNAPCLPNSLKRVDGYQGGVDAPDGLTGEEDADAPSSSDAPILDSEREDESSGPDTSQEETTDGIGMNFDVEESMPEKSTERRGLEGWPHEPRLCASVWPANDTGGGDNSTAAGTPRSVPPRLAFLNYSQVFLLSCLFFVLRSTEKNSQHFDPEHEQSDTLSAYIQPRQKKRPSALLDWGIQISKQNTLLYSSTTQSGDLSQIPPSGKRVPGTEVNHTSASADLLL